MQTVEALAWTEMGLCILTLLAACFWVNRSKRSYVRLPFWQCYILDLLTLTAARLLRLSVHDFFMSQETKCIGISGHYTICTHCQKQFLIEYLALTQSGTVRCSLLSTYMDIQVMTCHIEGKDTERTQIEPTECQQDHSRRVVAEA